MVIAGAVLVAVGVTLLLINTIRLRTDAAATIRFDNDFDAVVNVERLVVDAETGLGAQRDDIAILAVRFTGRTGSSPREICARPSWEARPGLAHPSR